MGLTVTVIRLLDQMALRIGGNRDQDSGRHFARPLLDARPVERSERNGYMSAVAPTRPEIWESAQGAVGKRCPDDQVLQAAAVIVPTGARRHRLDGHHGRCRRTGVTVQLGVFKNLSRTYSSSRQNRRTAPPSAEIWCPRRCERQRGGEALLRGQGTTRIPH